MGRDWTTARNKEQGNLSYVHSRQSTPGVLSSNSKECIMNIFTDVNTMNATLEVNKAKVN